MSNPEHVGARAQTDETNDLADWLDYCEYLDGIESNDDIDSEAVANEDRLIDSLWQDALESDWTE